MNVDTFIGSATTFLVGLFAFIVYKIEKNDKEKAAANIILQEIRLFEKNFDTLKEKNGFLKVTPSSLSYDGWNKQRHLILKYLDFDELNQLTNFFEKVGEIRNNLEQLRNIYYEGMSSKANYLQELLIEISEMEDYHERKEKILKVVHEESYWFRPHHFELQINGILETMQPISTNNIGQKIKKIIRKPSWRLF